MSTHDVSIKRRRDEVEGMVMKTKVEGWSIVVRVERRRGSEVSPTEEEGVVILGFMQRIYWF